MNDNLNGCQSPSVTELQRDGGPRKWWKEPAAEKSTKMQGIGLRIAIRYALQDPVPMARFAQSAKFDCALLREGEQA